MTVLLLFPPFPQQFRLAVRFRWPRGKTYDRGRVLEHAERERIEQLGVWGSVYFPLGKLVVSKWCFHGVLMVLSCVFMAFW